MMFFWVMVLCFCFKGFFFFVFALMVFFKVLLEFLFFTSFLKWCSNVSSMLGPEEHFSHPFFVGTVLFLNHHNAEQIVNRVLKSSFCF